LSPDIFYLKAQITASMLTIMIPRPSRLRIPFVTCVQGANLLVAASGKTPIARTSRRAQDGRTDVEGFERGSATSVFAGEFGLARRYRCSGVALITKHRCEPWYFRHKALDSVFLNFVNVQEKPARLHPGTKTREVHSAEPSLTDRIRNHRLLSDSQSCSGILR